MIFWICSWILFAEIFFLSYIWWRFRFKWEIRNTLPHKKKKNKKKNNSQLNWILLCTKEMGIMVVISCLALGFYPSWTYDCCDENTKTQSNLGRKGFVWFSYPESQSTEGSQGWSWCRSHGGVLLTGLLSLLADFVSTWHKFKSSERKDSAEEIPPWDPAVRHFLLN